MSCAADNSVFYRFEMSVYVSGSISWFLFIKRTSFQAVTKFIIENGNAFHLPYILFDCPLFERQRGVGSRPTFAIDENGRVDFQQFFSKAVHCFNVMYSHQVKAETVDMIFFCPEFH